MYVGSFDEYPGSFSFCLELGGLMASSNPKISLTDFVKFMMASSSQQRTILRRHKYEDDVEGVAIRKYYREAYNTLHRFYRGNHPPAWLSGQADLVAASSTPPTPRGQARIDHNVDSIRQFEACFGNRKIDGRSPGPMLSYSHDNLIVKVYTDIFGTEGRFDRSIKFHFADSKDPEQFAKIVCQVMFEAACNAGYVISSSAVRVWDRYSCKEYKLARVGARIRKDIEAACTAIVALWETL